MTYTYLRHASRHVHKTVIDRVRAGLVTDGWLDHADGQGTFGTNDIQFVAKRMEESELLAVQGNLVAVYFGPEPDTLEQELGGGLVMVAHQLFVDIVGDEGDPIGGDSLSLAIATDIKDRLSGFNPNTSRFETVCDYTTTPRTPVVGWPPMEFTNVVRSRPEGDDARRLWNIVACDVEVYMDGNE